MHVVVLCGGRGTRHDGATADQPKPLVPVAGRPLLDHLLQLFAEQGHTSFVLAAGFGLAAVERYAATVPSGWDVDVVDTGLDTGTGGRIRRCLDAAGETFFATYGDGLGDVDLDALLRRHREHAGAATVTAVPLPSQYGTLQIGREDVVESFTEKPVLHDHWINAGFLVFDRDGYAATDGDDLERDVLPAMAKDGELFVHRHLGFWRSMDTYKDQLELDRLAREGRPPWLR